MGLFKIEENEKYYQFNMSGDYIGGEETDKLRETIRDYAKKEHNTLVLNLKEVSYIDSATLGMFLSANALVGKHKGRMLLCNANDYISNIFEITKLNFVLSIHDSLEQAIADIK